MVIRSVFLSLISFSLAICSYGVSDCLDDILKLSSKPFYTGNEYHLNDIIFTTGERLANDYLDGTISNQNFINASQTRSVLKDLNIPPEFFQTMTPFEIADLILGLQDQKLIQRAVGGMLPADSVFLTWKPMGIEGFNLLYSSRKYLVGINDDIAFADGRMMNPDKYAGHDLGHAQFAEITLKQIFEARDEVSGLYKEILEKWIRFLSDYKSVRASFEKAGKDQEGKLFALGYYLLRHEAFIKSLEFFFFNSFKKRPDLNNLNEVFNSSYRLMRAQGIKVTYNSDGDNFSVRIIATNPVMEEILKRFIKPKDLDDVVPLELSGQISNTNSQDKKFEILTPFLEDILSILINSFYRYAQN